MKFFKILLISSVIFLVGCSSRYPKYINYNKPNSAVVEGDLGNFFKIIGGDSANVRVVRIDNKETRTLALSRRVSPGIHTLTLLATGAGTQGVANIKLNAKPNNHYKFIAKSKGDKFIIYLYNITNSKKKLIKTYTIKKDYMF